MKWLEVIKVRTLTVADGALSYLTSARQALAGNPELASMEVYVGLTAPTDIAVQLVWENEACTAWGSEPGQRIADCLKMLGLLSHTTWRLTEASDCVQTAACDARGELEKEEVRQ
jgi:hypothetical protein